MMSIDERILHQYPDLNPEQREIVAHGDGPLVVIAGPGSGKTRSIVLRALNLILLGKAQPKELVLCTFTNKAAYEMRDRFSAAARTVGYQGDFTEINISTIHSLCNGILTKHRHRTKLGHGYDTLDELTELLFIFEQFGHVAGEEANGKFLSRWRGRWPAIRGLRAYFNKITEELIDADRLIDSDDRFLNALGHAYRRYQTALQSNNRVDFAHLQLFVYNLLRDPDTADAITKGIRYILVDEYQDTNYLQEQLLLKLTEQTQNLCVVGDEDQSLYRFRGATVRNILEFSQRVTQCKTVKLTTNYRSHKDIIERYDHWMSAFDWTNPNGAPFRYEKTIRPDPSAQHKDYPAVISIWGQTAGDEAARFADMVSYLMREGIINDYSQVALLLHSVRERNSKAYIEALAAKGIPAFCPRARTFFDNVEIQDMVACFAAILEWSGENRGEVSGSVQELAKYVDESAQRLFTRLAPSAPLTDSLRKWNKEANTMVEGGTLDMRLADYFYQLLALEPFRSGIKNPNAARNLAIFSQFLNVFHNYYGFTVITHRNHTDLSRSFFNSFLSLLYHQGINEYEDPNQPLPNGHVQLMTIHQSKGLEFPVVVVGSLSNASNVSKRLDQDLSPFYQRQPFEPEERITEFDRMRKHYVAFSRPENLLVLTANKSPRPHFSKMWQGLPQWPYVDKDKLRQVRSQYEERQVPKRTYSFTGDLRIYETCPRQYQFFREYNFTPSRSAVIFFGLLVHQTIEDIHRTVLDGQRHILSDNLIQQFLNRNYDFLCLTDTRPIGEQGKQVALKHVLNYFRQNQEEMTRVIQTEMDVSLEKENYILTGKVDLLMGSDGNLELLDFKTSPRPVDTPDLLSSYQRQLCTYAHVMEQRYGRQVNRLLLYWTSEQDKDHALMTLPYDPQMAEEAGLYFDQTVQLIQAHEFSISKLPERKICAECDLISMCRGDGTIPVM